MDIFGVHILLPFIGLPMAVFWGWYLVRAFRTGRAGWSMMRTPYDRLRQPVGFWLLMGVAAYFFLASVSAVVWPPFWT